MKKIKPGKSSTPQSPAADAAAVQMDPGDSLGSLNAKLRDDPMQGTFEKMAVNFDPLGPKAKKIKNTYFA